ncbi:hypothetical protein PHYBOEH_009955 [Phytophthora boehmeriae]|uniref:RxLR effector protein n=1 Tax=Phytophthora boehmeriae TaxID=109152 RepID=A0A8T1VPQ4_9STRA|nr:hypothetical protein PHYBOEH_009955 [Phytophthora boehmeriae]
MRTSCFLFAAAASYLTIFGYAAGVSALGHTALSNTASVKSGDVVRFLRTRKTIEDDDSEDDYEGEERGLHDLVRSISYNKLDDVAEALGAAPGASKFLKQDITKLFKTIAAKKWTPESMADELGIAAKIASKSAALKFDPDYLLWVQYTKFWNARTAKA